VGKLLIDTDNHRVSVITEEGEKMYPIGSREAFSLISRAMLRVGWDSKYVYSFTWMGRPIIQLPDDMLRVQELIYRVKPDVIIETGIAHGGSLVFYAGLLKAMGRGRVVGVDIEIRQHNRSAIEAHELYPMITMYEGDSVDPGILEKLREDVGSNDKVLVFLDGNHTRDHVLEELRLYSEFVSLDS
jgi:cephalosporin hydroxylase